MIVRIRYLSVVAVLAIYSSALAQKTVDRQEYWIDGDVASRTTIAAGEQIDLTEQNVGPHTLTIRICDSEGVWSAPITRYFVKASNASPSATSIAQCEYWLDGKVDERQTVSDGAIISMDDLLVGPHTITVRIKDNLDVWSAPITRYFVKASVASPSATSIAQCEYWLDGKFDERQTVSDGAIIPMDDLLVGPHTITVRIKDNLDVWSAPITRYFIKGSSPSTPATSIVQCEYWFDGNTAERRNVNDFGELVLENLDSGIHTITVRSKDDLNVWSSPVTRYFVITAQKIPAEITRCIYWFDDDAEHAYSVPLSGSEGMAEISVFALLEVGEHTITWAVVDSEGRMSNTMTETFYIIVDGIKTIDNGQLAIDDESWYTLSGVKLNTRPTEIGIYIWKGKKVIVK
ncbi:MAG: hypothetical protein J6Y59_01235 [Bacteroidaceae bacterium]|nr:hypothetical protein [Bacteroidaceae bacterium]